MEGILEKKEEQYLLLTIEISEARSAILDKLRSIVVSAMEEGNFNFIIDFSNVVDFEPTLYVKLDEINHIVMKENGILVAACLQDANELLLKDLDIVSTPTLSEASDYVFMEEIERQFLTDPEENFDI